ncbi:MAG: nuclear transport factor 2 family protein [Parvularculaceae bacterium]
MRRLVALACLFAAACARTENVSDNVAQHCDNRNIVVSFYKEALVDLHPRAAFERYMSPDFIEHKPDVPEGTREATIAFLEALIADMPSPHWEIVRTIAEGDMVFLHARFSPAEGAPDYAIADIFRLQDCLIAEHWDVVAGPPEAPQNPNSRF